MNTIGTILLSLFILMILAMAFVVWWVKPPQGPTESEQKEFEHELMKKYLDKHKGKP